jgi:molecular chaperone DnaK
VIEARNRLDSLVYSVDKTLAENKEKLSAGELGEVDSALQDARKALESEELATLEGAAERLEKATHKLAEAMYRGAGGAGPQGGPTGGGAPQEDVIDAEVVDADTKSN